MWQRSCGDSALVSLRWRVPGGGGGGDPDQATLGDGQASLVAKRSPIGSGAELVFPARLAGEGGPGLRGPGGALGGPRCPAAPGAR